MLGEGEEEALNSYGDGIAWVRSSMIGRGSFGRVYLATLRNPSSKCSSLPPVMAVKSAEVSSSASLQKEREVYSNLQRNPYIIQCYGDEITFGSSGTMAFNLMLEYGSGGTLSRRIKESGGNGLGELESKLHTRSILRGLKHIHELGFVHCDLKPDNILLVPIRGKGFGIRAKIGDLGLARRVSISKKRKLGVCCWEGTPMYLSPEAVTDHVQEAPSDVWAVGCIVHEMLTGKSPLKGKEEELEILRKIGEGHEVIEIGNGVSKEARAFLKGCFVRNSNFRFTCEMLLLHPFLQGLDDDDIDDARVDVDQSVVPFDPIESFALVYDDDEDEYTSDSSTEEWSHGSETESGDAQFISQQNVPVEGF
ncbi:mitogen-activated protein kinase kinase kinase 20-like [Salvia splendens]|uniref:mitogen-activated protein kinase kinase kinase 20-like n=1 Tax=Salvia splendens TaxID=180675 RepID=UPI001C266D6C|nr:mitogen-activated protein kinase kinase kinase 20-like [Salvia splendens]